MTDQNPTRKHLTFEQAEGVEAIPTQLKLKEVSKELRALLWGVFYISFKASIVNVSGTRRIDPYFVDPWRSIFFDKHISRDSRMADEFDEHWEVICPDVKEIFVNGNYVQLFGFIQWVIRHPHRPYQINQQVDQALRVGRAAYRIIDGDTIVPIGSEAELKTVQAAFANIAKSEFGGARMHLRNAASEIAVGKWADSIRESIHAVESIARVMEPSAKTLGPALDRLAKETRIHPALKNGFSNLYGFTNDEKGIRHALLDEPVAAADETDALYMFGACASFVSYLIGKSRAGVVSDTLQKRSGKRK